MHRAIHRRSHGQQARSPDDLAACFFWICTTSTQLIMPQRSTREDQQKASKLRSDLLHSITEVAVEAARKPHLYATPTCYVQAGFAGRGPSARINARALPCPIVHVSSIPLVHCGAGEQFRRVETLSSWQMGWRPDSGAPALQKLGVSILGQGNICRSHCDRIVSLL